jgi:hypothetical protein
VGQGLAPGAEVKRLQRQLSFGYHPVQGTQTFGTHLEPPFGVADDDRPLLDIGFELSLGAIEGVADVMTELRLLTTYITFSHYIAPSI